MCDETEQAKCLDENGGDLNWVCSNCPTVRAEDLHPYTIKLLKLRMLQKAGFPLSANDLTLEEWFDLGRISEMLTTRNNEHSDTENSHRS